MHRKSKWGNADLGLSAAMKFIATRSTSQKQQKAPDSQEQVQEPPAFSKQPLRVVSNNKKCLSLSIK
jgi:hypothetical protein